MESQMNCPIHGKVLAICPECAESTRQSKVANKGYAKLKKKLGVEGYKEFIAKRFKHKKK
jgi:hypothetical protein